ncbi:fimbria/pilus periplasmic chaperone, partial [Escherichia coli]|uniref:fimbria/pilus periplasmic chaperone n=2 Tax=Escherichia coli TaxID=562 RepID=UPI003D32869A
MMTKIKLLMLIIFYLIISASAHAAGGIALGATRIIYPADAKQTAVWIRNSHTNERFLVNSWIENSSGVKEKSFIITPPLFVSEPKSENTLRIIYTGPPLAADRESLFWMNVKTIPSVDKNALNGSGFAPIFPDICYHLTHYKPAAADIPVASDNPAH